MSGSSGRAGYHFEPTEAWAVAQDRADPLARFRDAFALPGTADGRPLLYFCGHSLGLMPRAAEAEVGRELAEWARRGVDGHFAGAVPWYGAAEALQAPLARLVGGEPDEVVAMNSLTVNLHLLLVSLYRPQGKRCKILIEEGAFPSDAYAVTSHLLARGGSSDQVIVARPRPGEPVLRIEDLEALLAEQGGEIAIVWLGAVHFATGQLLDLERICRAGHAAGCLVGFDLAHAAGNVPLRLHDWEVDFAVWCSYKYLNGGPGAIGGAYLHSRHARDRRLPRFAGWWGNDPDTRFLMESHRGFVPVASAGGWQLSNPAILALAPLRVSLALFEEAGMESLRKKSVRLTGYLEHLIEARAAGRVELITPRDPAARGSQLTLRVPGGAERLLQRLKAQGVVVDSRDPDLLRVAPVPLYNTFQEVWGFGEALGEALREP